MNNMKVSLTFFLALIVQNASAAVVQVHVRDSTASNATQYAIPWLASFSNNNSDKK